MHRPITQKRNYCRWRFHKIYISRDANIYSCSFIFTKENCLWSLNERWFIWMGHAWTYRRSENQKLFLIEFILRLSRSQSIVLLVIAKKKYQLFHKRMSIKLNWRYLFTLELKVIKKPSLLIMTQLKWLLTATAPQSLLLYIQDW